MMIKVTHIDRIFRVFRPVLSGYFNPQTQQDGQDEGVVSGIIGLMMFSQHHRQLQMRLIMPGNRMLRDLLIKALWGNPASMKKILKLIMQQALKKSDLKLVIKTLTLSCNAGHYYAKLMLQTLALEAPAHVLEAVMDEVQRICQSFGNYQALEAMQEKPVLKFSQLSTLRPNSLHPAA